MTRQYASSVLTLTLLSVVWDGDLQQFPFRSSQKNEISMTNWNIMDVIYAMIFQEVVDI